MQMFETFEMFLASMVVFVVVQIVEYAPKYLWLKDNRHYEIYGDGTTSGDGSVPKRRRGPKYTQPSKRKRRKK